MAFLIKASGSGRCFLFQYYQLSLSRVNQKYGGLGFCPAFCMPLTISKHERLGVWISENKKTEYVTLWYKEKWKDKKGKADSIRVVDDCKIVNGKIAELDEKIQHFPAAKK